MTSTPNAGGRGAAAAAGPPMRAPGVASTAARRNKRDRSIQDTSRGTRPRLDGSNTSNTEAMDSMRRDIMAVMDADGTANLTANTTTGTVDGN